MKAKNKALLDFDNKIKNLEEALNKAFNGLVQCATKEEIVVKTKEVKVINNEQANK